MRVVSADEKRAFLARCRDDTIFAAESLLHVLDDTVANAKIQRLKLRMEQKQLIRLVDTIRASGKPQRILLLKARRIGFSLGIQALGWQRCVFNSYHKALVLAHQEGPALRIAKYMELFNTTLPLAFDAFLAKRDSKTGDWNWRNGSSYRVGTAGSKDALRSDGRAFGHLSEAAFFGSNRSRKHEENAVRAVLGSFVDHAGSCIIMESTSGGPTGEFYDRYMDAVNGRSEWYPVFYAFQNSSLYDCDGRASAEQRAEYGAMVRALEAADQKDAIVRAMKLGLSEVWMRRAREFGLTADQALWAQAKQRSDFKDDVRLFDREYPVSFQAAFNAGTTTPFDPEWLMRIRNSEYPSATLIGGNLEPDGDGYTLSEIGGAWHIYREPVDKHEYILGVDPALGGAADNSCIQIIDRHTHEQVAEFYANNMYIDTFAVQVLRAAHLFNDAFIIPEQCPQGLPLVKYLIDNGYPYIYQHGNITATTTADNWIKRYGYPTGGGVGPNSNKMHLFHGLFDEARKGLTVYSKRFLNETQTFVEVSPYKFDHMAGQHSDAIVAMALACYAHRYLPRPAELPTVQVTSGSVHPFLDKAMSKWHEKQPHRIVKERKWA